MWVSPCLLLIYLWTGLSRAQEAFYWLPISLSLPQDLQFYFEIYFDGFCIVLSDSKAQAWLTEESCWQKIAQEQMYVPGEGRNYRMGTPLVSHWSIANGHQNNTPLLPDSLSGALYWRSHKASTALFHVHKAGIHWWAWHPLNWHGCWQNSVPCSYKTTVVWSSYWLTFSTLVPQGWGSLERQWGVKKIGLTEWSRELGTEPLKVVAQALVQVLLSTS